MGVGVVSDEHHNIQLFPGSVCRLSMHEKFDF